MDFWCLQNYFAGNDRRGWRTITVDKEAEIMQQYMAFESAKHINHNTVKFRTLPYGDTSGLPRHGDNVWREPRQLH